MKNILIYLIISLILAGCATKGTKPLSPYEKVIHPQQNPYVSIVIPGSHPEAQFDYYFKNPSWLHISRTIPNMMSEDFTLELHDKDKRRVDDILDPKTNNILLLQKNTHKSFDKQFTNKQLQDEEITRTVEHRSDSIKRYINFIDQLKCAEQVEGSINGGDLGVIEYKTLCPYYNKEGLQKVLRIDVTMYFTFNGTVFDDGLSTTSSVNKHTIEDMKKQFQADLIEVFDSVQILDMDRERMRKEGFLYDKKYDPSMHEKALNLSFDCKFKEGGYGTCIGKETKRICTKNRTAPWECKKYD